MASGTWDPASPSPELAFAPNSDWCWWRSGFHGVQPGGCKPIWWTIVGDKTKTHTHNCCQKSKHIGKPASISLWLEICLEAFGYFLAKSLSLFTFLISTCQHLLQTCRTQTPRVMRFWKHFQHNQTSWPPYLLPMYDVLLSTSTLGQVSSG